MREPWEADPDAWLGDSLPNWPWEFAPAEYWLTGHWAPAPRYARNERSQLEARIAHWFWQAGRGTY